VIIPVERGAIDRRAVLGELRELIAQPAIGRAGETDITVFKSVGLAIEDLVSARLVVDRCVSYSEIWPAVRRLPSSAGEQAGLWACIRNRGIYRSRSVQIACDP
jgi:Ornithine cyclodeaminase/mu-crystallin family